MRILVLDDEIDIAESAALYIKQNTNWRAEYALTIEEAEKKLQSMDFDALILDRQLVDQSHRVVRWGDEFFRRIRCNPRFSKLGVRPRNNRIENSSDYRLSPQTDRECPVFRKSQSTAMTFPVV